MTPGSLSWTQFLQYMKVPPSHHIIFFEIQFKDTVHLHVTDIELWNFVLAEIIKRDCKIYDTDHNFIVLKIGIKIKSFWTQTAIQQQIQT